MYMLCICGGRQIDKPCSGLFFHAEVIDLLIGFTPVSQLYTSQQRSFLPSDGGCSCIWEASSWYLFSVQCLEKLILFKTIALDGVHSLTDSVSQLQVICPQIKVRASFKHQLSGMYFLDRKLVINKHYSTFAEIS